MSSVAKKLDEISPGVWAYTQLPGSWGWSNAGLIADGGESLLVDTLFDLKATAGMLESMRKATAAADRIETVVNTHGNGDHCYGNGLVVGAEIIGTPGCVDDLAESPPGQNRLFLTAAHAASGLGSLGRGLGRALRKVGLPQLEWLVDAAPLGLEAFSDFDFPWGKPVLPTRTFKGSLTLHVGSKRVEIVEAGPAHTRGDAYIYVPDDRVVFTGDLLFKDAHPIVWRGPVANWIAAIQKLLSLDVETVVPGHGPITDKSGLEQTLSYLELLTSEAWRRYDAGMPVEDAIDDIVLDNYRGWLDAERVYVNIRTLYRDFSGDSTVPHVLELFAGMSRYKYARTAVTTTLC